ncbi:hypothetical protein D3C81_1789210 [compost metagenome]
MAHGLSPVRADPANRFDLGAPSRPRIIVETNPVIASSSLDSCDENGCRCDELGGRRVLYLVAAIWIMSKGFYAVGRSATDLDNALTAKRTCRSTSPRASRRRTVCERIHALRRRRRRKAELGEGGARLA